MNDLKFAFRQLLKNPGFTAITVLTLALGIGANTAIFSVVNTTLLDPLPGPATDRLIQIAERTYTVGAFGQNVGKPNFLGPVAQGPPAGRFVYVNSGTSAGQADSCWTRRAKVPLTGIGWRLIERALAGTDTILEVQIDGKAKDGGPACATVPLLDGGWRISVP